MEVPADRLDAIAQTAVGTGAPAPPWPTYMSPARRPLKVFAFDPMTKRDGERTISTEIGNEHTPTTPLLPGPCGQQVKVIDYDGGSRCYYPPVDLNDPAILMQRGLHPMESDPRFHQQMVYAVAMKVIENFQQALGR